MLCDVIFFSSDGRWDIVGSSIVTNSYVRLTPDHQSRRGALWNNMVNFFLYNVQGSPEGMLNLINAISRIEDFNVLEKRKVT